MFTEENKTLLLELEAILKPLLHMTILLDSQKPLCHFSLAIIYYLLLMYGFELGQNGIFQKLNYQFILPMMPCQKCYF